MSALVAIRPMAPADLLEIERQPSQRVQLGLSAPPTLACAAELVEHGEAWTAWAGSRPVACVGLRETFLGRQAVAWAVLAAGVGPAHLAITRHARRRIAESPLVRIEAIVRANVAAEVEWARIVGLKPVALLAKFGALSEDHILFERVR